LRAHLGGLRRLARDERELFAVMGELALRARRDRAIAAIVRETDEVWHATLAGLLRRAQKEGAIAPVLKPDDAAGVIVATLKGIFILPADARDARRLDRTLDQLERWLGLSARKQLELADVIRPHDGEVS